MTAAAPAQPPLDPGLEALLRRMRLPYMRRIAPQVIATAKAQRWDPAEVLRALLAEEVAGRDRSALATRRARAAFPTAKTFDAWDEANDIAWGLYAAVGPAERPGVMVLRLRTEVERIAPETRARRLRRYVEADPEDWSSRRGPQSHTKGADHGEGYDARRSGRACAPDARGDAGPGHRRAAGLPAADGA